MDVKKIYKATIYFEPTTLTVYNCETLEDAEILAFEQANNLFRCNKTGIVISSVDVEEVEKD